MSHYRRGWMFKANPLDRLLGEQNVSIATTWPKAHFSTGLLADPLAKVLVGHKEDFSVFGYILDDFNGVATGANDIGRVLLQLLSN